MDTGAIDFLILGVLSGTAFALLASYATSLEASTCHLRLEILFFVCLPSAGTLAAPLHLRSIFTGHLPRLASLILFPLLVFVVALDGLTSCARTYRPDAWLDIARRAISSAEHKRDCRTEDEKVTAELAGLTVGAAATKRSKQQQQQQHCNESGSYRCTAFRATARTRRPQEETSASSSTFSRDSFSSSLNPPHPQSWLLAVLAAFSRRFDLFRNKAVLPLRYHVYILTK